MLPNNCIPHSFKVITQQPKDPVLQMLASNKFIINHEYINIPWESNIHKRTREPALLKLQSEQSKEVHITLGCQLEHHLFHTSGHALPVEVVKPKWEMNKYCKDLTHNIGRNTLRSSGKVLGEGKKSMVFHEVPTCFYSTQLCLQEP